MLSIMRPALPRSLAQGLRALQSPISRSTLAPSRRLSQLASRAVRPSATSFQTPGRVPVAVFAVRNNSGAAKPLTDQQSDPETDARNEEQNRQRREQEPAYQITFTCKPCGHRSSHRMSKHGYHRGTVLIRCPSCENRHIISDHLKIFYNEKRTLEDILAEQGNKLTRGYTNGDMEFWDDGTVTPKSGGEPTSQDGNASGQQGQP
ncbi:DNL zinc finger-domain-containing protein [Aspergillus ambiguus]|uniref:DNL-type zinc finger protein n=1 Tax=Aspergillus ambiguus TaxID=176160 RepID=UPI003CCD0B5D